MTRPPQESALRMEIATDEDRQSFCEVRSIERRAERNRLHDARVSAELLHEPSNDNPAEAVTDEMHARTVRNGRNDFRQALRDLAHRREGHMRERRSLDRKLIFETRAQRTKRSGGGEQAVNQNDYIVARPDFRHDRHDIANVDHAQSRHRFSKHVFLDARSVLYALVVPEPFSHFFEVPEEDIDNLGHASNIAVVRWVQDVAIAHSCAVGFGFDEYKSIGGIFVIRRNEIDYLRPVLRGERLELRTWLSSWMAAKYVRETEIIRADGIVAARAHTTWGYLDAISGRPKRVPDAVRNAFGLPPVRVSTPPPC